MLSKINKSNQHLGTNEILKYKGDFDIIQDNLVNYLLIKHNNEIILYNYINKRKIKFNKIPIYYKDTIFYKSIDSFDQNNIYIANKIRNTVLKFIGITDNIIGIGGEYYLYFHFIKANNYIGISNHQCIIDDAIHNNKNIQNYLVDYNNILTYPNINISFLNQKNTVIINVFNIHNNIIKYLLNNKIKDVIIISCNLPDKKLNLMKKHYKLKKIVHYKNFNTLITIIKLSF